jgi:hypothetical protein
MLCIVQSLKPESPNSDGYVVKMKYPVECTHAENWRNCYARCSLAGYSDRFEPGGADRSKDQEAMPHPREVDCLTSLHMSVSHT